MSILHLLWIVPLSALFGFLICALLSANGADENEIRKEK